MNWSQTTFIWRQQQQKHTNTLNLVLWHAVTILCVIFLYSLSPLKKVSHINWNIRANVCVIYNTTATKAISTGTGLNVREKKSSRWAWKMFVEKIINFVCTPRTSDSRRTVQRRTGIIVVINSFMNTMKMEAHDIHSCFFYLKTGKRKKKKTRKLQSSPSLNSYVYPV